MTGSWWILTFLLLLWIAGVTTLFLHTRGNIRKARERGSISNGLGMTITEGEKPASFRRIVYGWQFMSVVGLLFIAAGVIGLIIRVVQAI